MQEDDKIDRDLTDYRLEHVALEYFKAPAAQSELEKVTNMCTAPQKLDTSWEYFYEKEKQIYLFV